jgi:hypothetical protein
MAERLAQLYTSLTFGDPLLWALITTLLLPASSAPVQISVINGLLEVGSADLEKGIGPASPLSRGLQDSMSGEEGKAELRADHDSSNQVDRPCRHGS